MEFLAWLVTLVFSVIAIFIFLTWLFDNDDDWPDDSDPFDNYRGI